MYNITHACLGVLILKLLCILNPHMFSMNMSFIFYSVVFANLPDVDIFFSKTLKDHHAHPFHYPLFWISITAAVGIFIQFFPIFSEAILVLLLLQTIFHLIFDSITGRSAGIYLAGPFSEKVYSLMPLKPEVGNFKFFPLDKAKLKIWFDNYWKQKYLVLLEAVIIVLGIIFLI